MNRTHRIITVLLCALLSMVACREFPNIFEGEAVVARAGKETLRVMDVEKAYPAGITGADSLAWVQNYVARWVRDNLKLQEATRLFGENPADEELVEAYRNSLMLRRLEQNFITRATGDSLYTEAELHNYYNAHKADFTLDRTIVRGRVVALPSSFRQKARLKELFAGYTGDDREEARAIASKNGLKLDDAPGWREYPAFLEQLPTRRNDSYDNLATRPGVQEMTDGSTTYWFVIEEARTQGSVTPYEMVADIVRMAVASRRKAEVLKAYEDSLYRTAVTEKRAVVNL